MDKKINKKHPLIIILIILVLILSLFFISKVMNKKEDKKDISSSVESVLIPTIDASVKVDLRSISANNEAILFIENIPSKTESIDYELSYETAKQGLQGVIGTINVGRGQKKYEKKITLGTCSSGACVYHQVVGKIKLDLKFNGEYGERIFERKFSL